MPDADNSIALQLNAIERAVRSGKAVTPESTLWLITTLRREMATNESIRSSLCHLLARIDELDIAMRRHE